MRERLLDSFNVFAEHKNRRTRGSPCTPRTKRSYTQPVHHQLASNRFIGNFFGFFFAFSSVAWILFDVMCCMRQSKSQLFVCVQYIVCNSSFLCQSSHGRHTISSMARIRLCFTLYDEELDERRRKKICICVCVCVGSLGFSEKKKMRKNGGMRTTRAGISLLPIAHTPHSA